MLDTQRHIVLRIINIVRLVRLRTRISIMLLRFYMILSMSIIKVRGFAPFPLYLSYTCSTMPPGSTNADSNVPRSSVEVSTAYFHGFFNAYSGSRLPEVALYTGGVTVVVAILSGHSQVLLVGLHVGGLHRFRSTIFMGELLVNRHDRLLLGRYILHRRFFVFYRRIDLTFLIHLNFPRRVIMINYCLIWRAKYIVRLNYMLVMRPDNVAILIHFLLNIRTSARPHPSKLIQRATYKSFLQLIVTICFRLSRSFRTSREEHTRVLILRSSRIEFTLGCGEPTLIPPSR